MTLRFTSNLILATAFAWLSSLTHAQTTNVGKVEGNQYTSPTGVFRVTIPVIAEFSGTITDTENVVTFQDDFTTYQTIACFKMDDRLRHEEDTRGRKDFLIWFFSNTVQAELLQLFPGTRVESAHYIHSINDGALLTYNLLPGGSMFAERAVITNTGIPIIAKRGNLVFVKNGSVFIMSIELVEKSVENIAYTQTVAEQDADLRKRLMTLLDAITFASIPTAESAQTPAK